MKVISGNNQIEGGYMTCQRKLGQGTKTLGLLLPANHLSFINWFGRVILIWAMVSVNLMSMSDWREDQSTLFYAGKFIHRNRLKLAIFKRNEDTAEEETVITMKWPNIQ